MFEIGQRYRITMNVGTPEGWVEECSVWTVQAVEGNLIKLSVDIEGSDLVPGDYHAEAIVNTASMNFIKAEPVF